MFLPIGLLGKGEELVILGGLGSGDRRMLFQLKGQIRQALQIGVYLVPVDFFEKGFDALLVGLLIPGPACLLSVLHQIFILEERCPPHPPLFQILIQIRADAALGRVDLQPGQNGQHFGFVLKAFALLCV